MPPIVGNNFRNAKRRWKRKARNIYGTKPKFMPKTLARKRAANVSTRVMYFKRSSSINSDNSGNINFSWKTYDGEVGNDTTPPEFPTGVADSQVAAQLFSEYKVLSIKVRLFASNVGTETGQIASGANIPGFNRGDHCMYFDQKVDKNEISPTEILEVINLGSAKMIAPRTQKFTRTMFRPKGYPTWGSCNQNIDPSDDRTPDPWFGKIHLVANNCLTANQNGVRPVWFFTVTYKIIFRGRNFTVA